MKDINYWEIIFNRIKLLCRRKKIILFSFLLPLFVMGVVNFIMTALPSGKEASGIELGIVVTDGEELPYSFLQSEEFHIIYGSKEKMQMLLRDKKIDAYVVAGKETRLYITDMGRKQAVIKGYLDSGIQRMQSQENSADKPVGNNPGYIIQETGSTSDYKIQETGGKPVVSMTEPISLPEKRNLAFLYITAILCILGARWGFEEMTELMPGNSAIGKKLHLGPVSEGKILLLHLSCAYVLQAGCILAFSFIMLKTVGSSLQLRTELYLVVVALGALAGILTGALFSNIKRVNLKVKDIILNIVLIAMVLAAFFIPAASRYVINNKLSYLKLLNPPALITEMLYCIALQDGVILFLKDGLLLVSSILAAGIGLFILRKRWEA